MWPGAGSHAASSPRFSWALIDEECGMDRRWMEWDIEWVESLESSPCTVIPDQLFWLFVISIDS
jgi:hypothetical protein